jgi:CRP-like cAMP-binding protein
MTARNYRDKEIVFSQGDTADAVFYIQNGTVKLTERVGTTRAKVSKFMNVFKKKGLVSYNGGLQIDSTVLTAFLQNRPLSVSTKA